MNSRRTGRPIEKTSSKNDTAESKELSEGSNESDNSEESHTLFVHMWLSLPTLIRVHFLYYNLELQEHIIQSSKEHFQSQSISSSAQAKEDDAYSLYNSRNIFFSDENNSFPKIFVKYPASEFNSNPETYNLLDLIIKLPNAMLAQLQPVIKPNDEPHNRSEPML